jgi:hypothetical protein
MSKSSLAMIVAVLAAGLLGGTAERREHRAPSVRVHVRTARCELTGSSRPIAFAMRCV